MRVVVRQGVVVDVIRPMMKKMRFDIILLMILLFCSSLLMAQSDEGSYDVEEFKDLKTYQ